MLWLFVATTFTASALLFLVQPMFAKMALPLLGGAPAVWNTCDGLLPGRRCWPATPIRTSATNWLGARRQGPSRAAPAPAARVLPIALHDRHGPHPTGANPIWWLLKMMAVRVGLPFLVISTMAPVLQRGSRRPVPAARDPYFLYAASNLGSMLALLAYPLFVERFPPGTAPEPLGVGSGGFRPGALTAACAVAGRHWGRNRRSQSISNAAIHNRHSASNADPIPTAFRAPGMLLAFVPSSLMLGVTTYISTDLAPMPSSGSCRWRSTSCTFTLVFGRRQIVPENLDRPAAGAPPPRARAGGPMRSSAPADTHPSGDVLRRCAMVCHTSWPRTDPIDAPPDGVLSLDVGRRACSAAPSTALVATYVFNGTSRSTRWCLSLACSSADAGSGRMAGTRGQVLEASSPLALCIVLWALGLVGEGVGLSRGSSSARRSSRSGA